MKVDGAISSLIQGVSQQAARERLEGQCEKQVNCSSDPVRGLTRRGPTEFIDNLINSGDEWYFSDYDGGSLGHFIIANKAGEIKVFDLEGTEYTVNVTSGSSYIPDAKMEIVGIDEAIYCLAPDVETATLSDTKTYVEDGVLAFLLGGQYGRTYTIRLDWEDSSGTEYTETVTYTTPDGSTSSHISNISTTNIATSLESSLNGNTNINTNFDVERSYDVLYIKKKDAADVEEYRAEVSDGDGGKNMFVVNNNTKDVGDLPRYAPHGYICKVTESGQSDVDDWYLEFISDDPDATLGSSFGTDGSWVEAVAPDTVYKLDVSTMPHVLEKTGATEFTFSEGEWAERAVGDDETNPMPSFVGHTITDMGAFQGRLVLLSDVNCIMSRTNNHTDFFKQSATVDVDDDPIDISSSIGRFVLKEIVPHNRDLILFSDKAQFIVFGRTAITPKNSSLVLTTEFEADLNASPESAGRNVYFAYKQGQYTGIHEFYTEGSQDANDSRPVTSHVLKYIQGTATQIVTTTNFNKVIVRTNSDDKVMYLYEYIWLNDTKAQSSWSTWTFHRDILHMFFVDNLLYLVTKTGTEYSLSHLNLDDTEDLGLEYRVMLDDKYRIAATTTFVVPYSIDDIENYVCVQGPNGVNPGMLVQIDGYSAGTVTLKQDMSSEDVIFGRRYVSEYVPTQPFVRDRNGVKIGSGKLTIKNFAVHFENSGYIAATVTDAYGYNAMVTYEGRVLGDPDNIIGEPAIDSGAFQVPFKKNADRAQLELSSNSHLPMYLVELEWVGQWRKKGRRITGGG